MPCTVAENRNSVWQALKRTIGLCSSFGVVAFDIQAITPETSNGNIEVVEMMDLFNRYVRAVAKLDEKVETLAQNILVYWIYVFWLMDRLFQVPEQV